MDNGSYGKQKDGIMMRGVNKIIIALIIGLSFISCKSKREDIISFLEYDYSQITDYPSLYEELEKQGCKPGVTEYYYPISSNERLLIEYHIDSKTLYIDVFDFKSKHGMPSNNVIQKYIEILTEKYGEPDYGDFCKHRWNNFVYEEYHLTLPYWKTKNSKQRLIQHRHRINCLTVFINSKMQVRAGTHTS